MDHDDLNWGMAAGLVGMTVLAIAAMLGFGFGLAWFAERVV